MSTVTAQKGRKVYIGTIANTDLADAAAYEALTFVEIKEVTSLSDFGTDETVNSVSPLVGVNRKFKGNIDAGTLDIEYSYIEADAGQVALRAAGATRDSYAVKVEENDAPTGKTNTIYYSRGVVKAPQIKGGGGDDAVSEMCQIGFEQLIIKVDPATIP
jgi:hypothetical protein